MDQQGSLNKSYQLIIFDLDGTLVNIDLAWDEMKKEISDYLKKYNISEEMTPIIPKINKALKEISDKNGEPETVRREIYNIMDRFEAKATITQLSGASQVLSELKKNNKNCPSDQ